MTVDPEIPNQDLERVGKTDVPQNISSNASPRSMPWPEIPSPRTKNSKKKPTSPTKPNQEDEWQPAFQETDVPFTSNEDRAGSSFSRLNRKSSHTPPSKKSSIPLPSGQNPKDAWVANSSHTPTETLHGTSSSLENSQSPTSTQEIIGSQDTGTPTSSVPPPPATSKALSLFSGIPSEGSDQAPAPKEIPVESIPQPTGDFTAPVPLGLIQETPGKVQAPDLNIPSYIPVPVPPPPSKQTIAPSSPSPLEPEPSSNDSPVVSPSIPLPLTGITDTSDEYNSPFPQGSSPHGTFRDVNQNLQDSLQDHSQISNSIPRSHSPVAIQQAPTPSLITPPNQSLPDSAMANPPTSLQEPSVVPQDLPGPVSPTAPIPLNPSYPIEIPVSRAEVTGAPDKLISPTKDPYQVSTPNPGSYAPVTVPVPTQQDALEPQGPSIISQGVNIYHPEVDPTPTDIQDLMKVGDKIPTTPNSIPLESDSPGISIHQPLSPPILPTMEPPGTEPPPQPTNPITWGTSSPTEAPLVQTSPPKLPTHSHAATSLDEEWMASQNETPEDLGKTISSTPVDLKINPSTPSGIYHTSNQLLPSKDWNPSNQQSGATSKDGIGLPTKDSLPPYIPPSCQITKEKQNVTTPTPAGPEGNLSSSATDENHMVQAWPSIPLQKTSRKPRPGQEAIGGVGGDTHQHAKDPILDSEFSSDNQSGDEEFGPFRLRHPTFTGNGRTLFGIFTTNSVWTLLTLGIYSFWGRVNIRRYLHGQTKFAGARFAFHGTGGELLLGWMKALVAFGTPYLALNYFSHQTTEVIWQWALYGLAGILVGCLLPTAIVGSHRYRMSRTSWRGIRFSFRRSVLEFTGLYLKGVILSILTLGMYYPIFENARRAFLTSGTYFGNQPFGFDGDPKILGQLYYQAFRRLVLTLVTAEVFLLSASFLGTHFRPNQVVDLVFLASVGTGTLLIPFLIGIWFWFQAAKQRYMWNHMTFGPGRFRGTMNGWHLFELQCTNLILLLFSLGLAWPWVKKRNLQFQYYHIGYRGPLRLQHIIQHATSASPIGEELAGFFDAGVEM